MIYDRKKDVIKKMKETAKEIVAEESAKKGIDIIIHPMTIVEYYRSDIFKTNLVLSGTTNNKKIDYMAILEPLKSRAFYMTGRRELVVFIKNLNKIKKVDFEIVWADFIVSIYHELKHRFQVKDRQESKKLNSSTIIYDIELLIRSFDYPYYRMHHDKFYCEIEAQLYGVNSALDYLKRKNTLTSLQEEHLEARKSLYNCYDLQTMLDEFNHIIQNEPQMKIINWLKIFYNQDKTFKTVSQILHNPNVDLVDEEFLDAFFSNKEFLESFDFVGLNPIHQQIIIKALNNTLNLEVTKRKNMREALNEKRISSANWPELDTLVASRIAYYTEKTRQFINKQSKIEDDPNEFIKRFKTKE